MTSYQFLLSEQAIDFAFDLLRHRGLRVDSGRWQGVPTEGKPDLVTKEVLDLNIAFSIPHTMDDAQDGIRPNLPWAEDHFQERVSRIPSNPGEQYKNWPWWRGQDEVSMTNMIGTHSTERDEAGIPTRQFTHTYQERFWPKVANVDPPPHDADLTEAGLRAWYAPTMGIRYEYGDLDSVIDLLRRDPQSRQAYLPIFFPEDTGAVHGGRIPCTLGYHFLLRSGLLHCWYDIRSCDAVRHFRDDLYLATRLVQWVIAELVERELRDKPHHGQDKHWVDVDPGTLFFKAHSFHVHMGDYHLLP